MVLAWTVGVFYLFSDFFYWSKWAASLLSLRLWKKFYQSRFDLYDFETENQAEKLAILVPKEERILESPVPEEHLTDAADEIFAYGVNSQSQSLVIRVSRAANDEAEACVYLKLKDGRWFELQDRSGYQRNYGGKCTSFTCGGLRMQYLIPMRRWRFTYCGMLKEGGKRNENKENNEVFVKFSFLWTASSDVFDPSSEFDIRSAADAMAKAKWPSPIPPVHKVSENLNFYYQSGVISGLVSIEDQPDEEMYLYGERIRYLGKHSHSVGCKFKHILGVTPKSGLVVHLGRSSVPNTFHNLPFGFIVHPDGRNRVIEDGIIISRMSGKNESGDELTAMFTAGRQYELRGNFVGDGVRLMSEHSWNAHLELVGIEFEIDGLQGSGFMVYGEVLKVPERKLPSILLSIPSERPLTVFFTDESSHSSELTGGKGSSLGMLTKLSNEMEEEDFVVPKGIVVTTAAYQEFLTADVIDKIETMKDIAYGNISGNIHEACKIVMHAIERTYLPDKITKEIEEKLRKISVGNLNQQKFAVRSSATGEDTDQMSAAGQMDTFLGVQGLKEIFTAVKKCWASQFGYITTEYKRQNGQILNSPMAVVIQQMVDCEEAGVLFTCDPVTNNPSVIFITGNYGLGESVVSGSEEPDTVVLKKISTSEVEIKSVSVGLKQHRTVMADIVNEEDTVITEDVPEDKRNECCISQEMALRLGELSLKIEAHFKSPRDIEWGIKDNTVYILQSRPITTGVAVSDYEIKHEFDGPVRCDGDFYTLANVGEVMPGAMSPLGIDIMGRSLTAVFQRNSMRERQKNAYQQHKYHPSGFCVPFYNHMSMEIVDVLNRVADMDSTASQSMMIAFFGRILDDPELRVISRYRYTGGDMEKNLMYYIKTIKNLFSIGRGVEELKEKIFSYNIPVEKGNNAKEIFDIVMRDSSHNIEPFLAHVFNTEMASLWNMYLLSVLGHAEGSIDTDVYSDFAKLLSSSSNVESADVPSAIEKLAQVIVSDASCEKFKSMSLEEAQKWLETTTCLSGYKYRQFIKRHGHRCLKEFDMQSVTWGMDPKPLIKLLKNMSDSCKNMKARKVENISEVLSQLKVPLSFKTKIILRCLLPNCRRGVRMRETCKSIVIKSMDNQRKGFQHLGKAMVAEGYLPDTGLLYFLAVDEITELLETRSPGIISRAHHRRKLFPTLEGFILPEIWRGQPTPVNETEEEVEYIADLTMKGIPVSQGTIKGYARIALTIDEAFHIKQGEILITHCTDIGWSPYFPILAGVVTELGGLVSHGAVVSREYGLPCVVGLHGATKMFKTGDYVLLDGNKGLLQRLAPPDQ